MSCQHLSRPAQACLNGWSHLFQNEKVLINDQQVRNLWHVITVPQSLGFGVWTGWWWIMTRLGCVYILFYQVQPHHLEFCVEMLNIQFHKSILFQLNHWTQQLCWSSLLNHSDQCWLWWDDSPHHNHHFTRGMEKHICVNLITCETRWSHFDDCALGDSTCVVCDNCYSLDVDIYVASFFKNFQL